MKSSSTLMPQPLSDIPKPFQMQSMIEPTVQETRLQPSVPQQLAFQILIGSQSGNQIPPIKFSSKPLSVHLSSQSLFNHYCEVLKLDPHACHQWFITHNEWKSLLHSSFKLNTNQQPIQYTLAGLALIHKQFSTLGLCMQSGSDPEAICDQSPLYLAAFEQGCFKSFVDACKMRFPISSCLRTFAQLCQQRNPATLASIFHALDYLKQTPLWTKEVQEGFHAQQCLAYYELLFSISCCLKPASSNDPSLQVESSHESMRIIQMLLDCLEKNQAPAIKHTSFLETQINQYHNYSGSPYYHTALTRALELEWKELIPLLARLNADPSLPAKPKNSREPIFHSFKTAFNRGILPFFFQAYGPDRFPSKICLQELLGDCNPLSIVNQLKAERMAKVFLQMIQEGFISSSEIKSEAYQKFVGYYQFPFLIDKHPNKVCVLPSLAYTEQDIKNHFNQLSQIEQSRLADLYGKLAHMLVRDCVQIDPSNSTPLALSSYEGYLFFNISHFKNPWTLWEQISVSHENKKLLAHHWAQFLKLSGLHSVQHPLVKEVVVPQLQRSMGDYNRLHLKGLPDSLPSSLLNQINVLFFQLKLKEWQYHIRHLALSLNQTSDELKLVPSLIVNEATPQTLTVSWVNLLIHPTKGLQRVAADQQRQAKSLLDPLFSNYAEWNNQTHSLDLDESATQAFIHHLVHQKPDCLILHNNHPSLTEELPFTSEFSSLSFWQKTSQQTFHYLASKSRQGSFGLLALQLNSIKQAVPLNNFHLLPVPYLNDDSYLSAIKTGHYLATHSDQLKTFLSSVLTILNRHPQYRHSIRTNQWSQISHTTEGQQLKSHYHDLAIKIQKAVFTSQMFETMRIDVYEYHEKQSSTHLFCEASTQMDKSWTLNLLRKFKPGFQPPYFDLLIRNLSVS